MGMINTAKLNWIAREERVFRRPWGVTGCLRLAERFWKNCKQGHSGVYGIIDKKCRRTAMM